jgi:hypothetical protein
MTTKGVIEPSIGLTLVRSLRVLAGLLAIFPGMVRGDVRASDAVQGDILVVRLVHPDGQAVAVLKLFDGARVSHPAAALASWKAAARPPLELGKPLEALIASFNPEMASEWHVVHGARLAVNWDAAHGRLAWYALVPRDDGTIAAAVAATRLSEGASETSLDFAGKHVAVERLGRPGAAVAAQAGDTLIFGSSREELLRVVQSLAMGKTALPAAPGRGPAEEVVPAGSGEPLRSGLGFVLDGSRLAAEPGLPPPARFAAELLRGLSCRRLEGSLALVGDCLGLDLSTLLQLDGGPSAAFWRASAPIDPVWLESVPRSGAMAVIALAIRPTPEFWDSAFALADRLEKTDPARAETAPLRVRLNLVARTAGVRLELDLWPHLRGITAGILGEPGRPGRATGALVAFHLDSEAAAEQLLSKSSPGLAKLVGRDLTTWLKGREVLVTWGNGVATAARDAAARPELSVAPLCTGWIGAGKPAPERLIAFWPARCWPLDQKLIAQNATWSVLTEDPPALWLGWHQESKAFDSIRWPGLERRVHRFLEQIP